MKLLNRFILVDDNFMNNHKDIQIRATSRILQERITESILMLVNYNHTLKSFEDEYNSDGNLPSFSQFLNMINLLKTKNTDVVSGLVDLHEEVTLFIRKIELLREEIDVFVKTHG